LVPQLIFISIWSLFWEIWPNQVLSVSGGVTVLNGVSRVNFWIFWIFFEFFFEFFFYFFWIFLKFLKKLKFCHMSNWHRATWQWQCHVSLFGRCHFFILNLVPLFYFLFQFSLNFCKNYAISSLPNWNKNYKMLYRYF